jgi:tRNA threonylcarbamoyladenosine biosynthesis protein TsaE
VLESCYMKESYSEDQNQYIAKKVLDLLPKGTDKAAVLCLYGELGAGKTSLTQAIAAEVGIAEKVLSPTFVIAKWYTPKIGEYKSLVHIDAYRIESDIELQAFRFSEILNKNKTLVIIEWPENISNTLQNISCFKLKISHDKEKRMIESFE